MLDNAGHTKCKILKIAPTGGRQPVSRSNSHRSMHMKLVTLFLGR
jgi:hypothetical protein